MTLPERPALRRIIVVLDETDYDRLAYDPEAAPLVRPEIAALLWPAEPGDTLALRLEGRGLARPGAVLLQSPYDGDDYAMEGEAAEVFSLQKFATFSVLCQILGARQVSVVTVQEDHKGEVRTLDAKVGSGPISATANVRSKGLDRLAASMAWQDSFAGGPADVEAARALLVQRGLDHDPILGSLIDSRAYAANRHESRTLTVDLTREADQTLSIAAGLKVPAYLSASATFRRELTSSAKYRVEYRVDF